MLVNKLQLSALADILQDSEHRLIRALLYPAGSARPRMLLLPARLEPDVSAPWMSDFDLTPWFPGGTRQVNLTVIPATNFALRNAYTIVTAAIHTSPSINSSLQETLGIYLRGNLLVFRHSARRPLSVVSVHNAERRLIDLVLYRYVLHSPAATCRTPFLTDEIPSGVTDSS